MSFFSHKTIFIIKLFVFVEYVIVFGKLKDTFRLGNKTLYISKEPAIWHDAKKFCNNNHMDLLSIRSLEEAKNIKRLNISKFFWSGGNNLENPAIWTWSGKSKNNNKFVYTNWEPSQPNNPRGDHCVAIYNYFTWNDYNCVNALMFICENTDDTVDAMESTAEDKLVAIVESDQQQSITDNQNMQKNEEIKTKNSWKDDYNITNIYDIIKQSMLQQNGHLISNINTAKNNSTNIKIEILFVKNLIIDD